MLFLKDIEKAMVGNTEVLKSKLEGLPQNVVVIGSHTQPDNRKEKVLFNDYIVLTLLILAILRFMKSHCCKFELWHLYVSRPILVAFCLQSLGAIRLHYLILHFRYNNHSLI